MARQGWGGSIATACGVAAGAGAAQLGFGYGLGILNWAPDEATVGTAAWVASLIWATWIAATSTIFGAVCAQRLHDRRQAASPPDAVVDESAASDAPVPPAGEPPAAIVKPAGGGLWGIALAVAAGLGALITVLLVAVPARVAVVPDTPSPRDMAAGYAAVGVLVGTLVAVWTLRCRAAATNVIATAGWLWLLAVIAVVDSVIAGRGLTTAQLGIWQLSSGSDQFWIRDYFYWPGAVLSLGSALIIGALAARSGVRTADRRVGATASGAAGPLLVAIAYFLAVPRLTAISPEQVSAHLIAPYAVIVGIGGSVLLAALAQRSARLAQSRSSSPGAAPVLPRQRVGDTDRLTEASDPDTDRSEPGTRPRAGTTAGEVTEPRTDAAPTPAASKPAPTPAASKPAPTSGTSKLAPAEPGAARSSASKKSPAPKSSTTKPSPVEAGTESDPSPSGDDTTPQGSGGGRGRQQRRGR
ncbi:hypothetical protein ACLQ2S_07990 [Micromonospora sp. DT48]|uniref:hypothetical protein n=1 Tax=unclassified Micromonospora TaxID=2617518 RepID=UPI001E56C841|nr:hypothetical protein [Micromonospora sp. CP22]